jgi:type I restriction enzyme S subunit
MTWAQKPLSEILDLSGRHRAGDQELPVLSITMKYGLIDQADKFKKRIASSDTSNYRIAYKNELVVGFPIDEGVLGFQTKYPAGIVSPAYDIWKLKSETDCHIPYLERYLRSPQARSLYASRMQGAVARRRSLTKVDFLNLEIPFPSLDDQIRIAFLLSKVEGLIAQRKHHLQLLDDLLKSLFLETFGDIRAKKSNHPWESLRPYLKASSGKSSKNVISDVATGIPIFGGNGINGWSVEVLYETPIIIVGRVGQQCGVVHTSKEPCWVTDNAIAISIVDTEVLNIVYLAKAFHYAPIRDRVKQLDLPFINQSMLLDYPLPLPPLALQNKFTSIVEKVESIKIGYQKSLVDLETLYNVLNQRAFKGELDLSRIPLLGMEPKEPKAVVTDAVQAHTEENLALILPEIDNLPDALKNAETRKALIAKWLEAYHSYLGSTPFSVQRFMEAAQTRMTELHPDNDFELGICDYEHIKILVFEALAGGRLQQARDITGLDESGELVLGNLVEITSGGHY